MTTHHLTTVKPDAGNASEARFVDAYIEAALWASDDDNGDSLADSFEADDIAPETRAQIEKDCAAFLAVFWADLFRSGIYQGRATHHAVEMAGHDFWLTRNGHGAGFWDGDWQEPYASQMDVYSKRAGAYTLYIGDDGKIYGMKG
jgi:hypothetical protein